MCEIDSLVAIEVFMNFLVNHNCLGKFIHNLDKQKGISTSDYVELKAESKLHYASIIGSAFTWDITPEGHDFWNEISSKWYLNCDALLAKRGNVETSFNSIW